MRVTPCQLTEWMYSMTVTQYMASTNPPREIHASGIYGNGIDDWVHRTYLKIVVSGGSLTQSV